VKIIFGHTASSLPNRNSKIPLPESLIEAYGEGEAEGYKEARQTFMKTMAGRMRKIGSSVRMAAQTGSNQNLWKYMPVMYDEAENEEGAAGAEAPAAKSADENTTNSPQKQAEAEPSQPQSVLAGLQDELRQLTASPADFTGKDDKINELKAKVA
jgi:hypothetical protein